MSDHLAVFFATTVANVWPIQWATISSRKCQFSLAGSLSPPSFLINFLNYFSDALRDSMASDASTHLIRLFIFWMPLALTDFVVSLDPNFCPYFLASPLYFARLGLFTTE
jgi:hypothetical protein